MISNEVSSSISPDSGFPMAPSGQDSASVNRGWKANWLFLIAIWFGMLTGFSEVILLTIRKLVFGRFMFLSPYVVWMAPLANLLLFSVLGLILWLAARRYPALISLRVAAFVVALPSFLSVLLLFPQLHRYAALALSVGLALQVARFIGSRSNGFRLLVRHSVVWVVALIVGSAVVMHGWQGFAERNALAKLPPASADAPNVLLIVLDTVRAKSLSVYGNARVTTPQLERFANTGVRFERAISPAPWTTPAHASMFTGRSPHEISVDRSKISGEGVAPLDATYPTLAEVLTANGYVTAGFVANVEYCASETGLNRGFAHYEDYSISPGEILLSSSLGRTIVNSHEIRRLTGYYDILGRKTAAKVNSDFLDWLSKTDRKPFFAFLNYYDAHEPYLPPATFDAPFQVHDGRDTSLIVPSGIHQAKRHDKEVMSDREIQGELMAYETSIAYIDNQLGLLFGELSARGVLENTLVIITSDHGEQFGEHGLFDHGNSLYMPLLHVPLLISFPSHVPEGVSVNQAVSLSDIPATVLDIVGLGAVDQFPGTSITASWQNANINTTAVLSEATSLPRVPAWYPIAKGDMKSLIVGRHHYIKKGDGSEELFDIETDPLESNNLASSDEGKRILAQMRPSLESILARNQPRF